MRKKKTIDTSKIINFAVKKDLCWEEDNVRCEELSDGNVNYLFRIINKETRESVVIKIADGVTRVRPDGDISKKRNKFEANILMWFGSPVIEVIDEPTLKVPKVISINEKKNYFLMEDIVPSISLRQALMEGVMPEKLGISFATFIAISQVPFVSLIQRDGFKDLFEFFNMNDDLIKITEDLVFKFPFFDERGRNIYTEGNEKFLEEKINLDKRLCFVSAKLLNKFKTYKQSMIHGDLHTGSVLVKFDGKKIIGKPSNNMDMYVIDTEFATLAPIAYDIGNVIAHLTIAEIYNVAKSGTSSKRKMDIHNYFSNEIEIFISHFRDFSYRILRCRIKTALYKSDRFIRNYIESIIRDAWKFAGLEIIRRVVGSAKVPELTDITDIENRIVIERTLVKVAKDFIFLK